APSTKTTPRPSAPKSSRADLSQTLFERSRKGERALLVQPQWVGESDPDALAEFRELARSAGASVVGTLNARIERPNPKFFIGSGKADEVKALKLAENADLILVNHALSPVQERNLEQFTQCRVVEVALLYRTERVIDQDQIGVLGQLERFDF